MHDFFTSISTEIWIALAVIVNRGLAMLTAKLSKKKMAKDVKDIKEQVTPNGGNSLSDKIEKLALQIDAYFIIMLNRDGEALVSADENGEWKFCNNKVADIFGMYHRDMLGKGWEIAIGRSINERYNFVKAWNDFVKDGSPLNHQIWINNQDNSAESGMYLATASKVMTKNVFQFFLIKFQKIPS